jgi:hypothetical protein
VATFQEVVGLVQVFMETLAVMELHKLQALWRAKVAGAGVVLAVVHMLVEQVELAVTARVVAAAVAVHQQAATAVAVATDTQELLHGDTNEH